MVVAVVVLAFTLLVTSTALAWAVSSTQTNDKGTTTRTIWGKTQVAIYKIAGVNHTGYMHFDLTWKNYGWADFDVYIVRYGQAVNESEGYIGQWNHHEVIDYRVTNIVDQSTAVDAKGHTYVKGDTYYVVVVAFTDEAYFTLNGYVPMILAPDDTDTTGAYNFYNKAWTRSARLIGPQSWGAGCTFVPTSDGAGEARLEWPANVTTKTVTYDPINAPSPANMEQYAYLADWTTPLFEDYGSGNWTPPTQTGPPLWYGLSDTFTFDHTNPAIGPRQNFYYVPSLYLVANDATLGASDLKTGISTIGYKATLLFPMNLYMTSAPSKVLSGHSATIKGNFALNGAYQVAADVIIQKRVGSVWKTVKTVHTNASGKWTATVKPTVTTYWRATATGDATTGVAHESTLSKRIFVL